MSSNLNPSPEYVIDRSREELIAKVINGTAAAQERAQLEELSSERAALMKRPMTGRIPARARD